MEPSELKRKRKEFLEDTWKHYAEDVSRRAIDYEGGKTCLYKTTDGRRCAIGRHIPDEKYNPNLEGCGIGNGKVCNMIPKDILDLGEEFLIKIQMLHDEDINWNNHGLSGPGEQAVADIEEDFINCL